MWPAIRTSVASPPSSSGSELQFIHPCCMYMHVQYTADHRTVFFHCLLLSPPEHSTSAFRTTYRKRMMLEYNYTQRSAGNNDMTRTSNREFVYSIPLSSPRKSDFLADLVSLLSGWENMKKRPAPAAKAAATATEIVEDEYDMRKKREGEHILCCCQMTKGKFISYRSQSSQGKHRCRSARPP